MPLKKKKITIELNCFSSSSEADLLMYITRLSREIKNSVENICSQSWNRVISAENYKVENYTNIKIEDSTQ